MVTVRFELTPLARSELESDALTRLAPDLELPDNTVLDLYGCRNFPNGAEWTITSRPTRDRSRSFGNELRPHEANIILSQAGEHFNLTRIPDLLPLTPPADRFARQEVNRIARSFGRKRLLYNTLSACLRRRRG